MLKKEGFLLVQISFLAASHRDPFFSIPFSQSKGFEFLFCFGLVTILFMVRLLICSIHVLISDPMP